jgi:hypothetical protein
MAAIVSLADLKLYLREEKPTVDDPVLTSALNTAINLAKFHTHRDLTVASGPATTRMFNPSELRDHNQVLRIDDCTSVTSVAGSQTVNPSTYQVEPLNGLTRYGEARPYDQIRNVSAWVGLGTLYTFTVTATWGWLAIPDPIVEAVKVMAKDIAGNRDVQNGIVGFTDAGAASARKNQFVQDVFSTYRRAESFGVG